MNNEFKHESTEHYMTIEQVALALLQGVVTAEWYGDQNDEALRRLNSVLVEQAFNLAEAFLYESEKRRQV
ncbi:MAG: hypothetical protein OEY89_02440 [Gammaproteobacteria bacterium]|nr:hypothetical protein [Gammaproteobacteria bacterium]